MQQSLFSLAALAASLFSALATAQCARETLVAATNKLLEAQTSGKPEALGPLEGVAYLEQFKKADATKGILIKPLAIDFNRSLHDTVQCTTYTEMISAKGSHPYVIGTQMHFTPEGVLTNFSSLVTDQGDWLFNATGTLYVCYPWSHLLPIQDTHGGHNDLLEPQAMSWELTGPLKLAPWASREKWDVIPEDQRDSRETIKAAADAYADIFNNKTVKVPWGTPCARLEGGMYTGSGSANDRCDVGIPNGVKLVNRRYVIDETIGAVDVFIDFATVPDSHEFRVEKGKIRYVHTLTVMGG
ncbi:hypothetical protein F5B22DRAFT_642614 [Xylaria bambusicola]|uniref:uncharacterized protein n=1 Tax=Xylaria bambusicola TaxID=326684 RepID=UPI002007E1A2|nr:uncharacterized protein F5B22DRAFT_642614 [Xylaria bambusicola]KAI0525606.1 hypothetical protein F5B22DRAFT_642614 [Xylaria bambusicola]